MRAFLTKTLVFCVTIPLGIAGLFFLENTLLRTQGSFKVNKDAANLIVGHSHSACAFNDSIIHNTVNLSQSGEAYFWTYLKVKEIIRQNPGLKKVFIEFSNGQIEKAKDNWIWGDEYLSRNLLTYLPFLELEEAKVLIKNNRTDFFKATSKAFRTNIMTVVTRDFNYTQKVGGYWWIERNHVDSLLKNVDFEGLKPRKTQVSEMNIKYLSKIISYCKDKNIQVYLVRAPQHKYYISRRNEETFQEVRTKHFGDIAFLDFNEFPASNDEFGDFDHLNHTGARVFSKFFQSLIGDGLLQRPDVEEYVISRMEVYKNQLQLDEGSN